MNTNCSIQKSNAEQVFFKISCANFINHPLLFQLTKKVGSVSVQKPSFNYLNYQPKEPVITDDGESVMLYLFPLISELLLFVRQIEIPFDYSKITQYYTFQLYIGFNLSQVMIEQDFPPNISSNGNQHCSQQLNTSTIHNVPIFKDCRLALPQLTLELPLTSLNVYNYHRLPC